MFSQFYYSPFVLQSSIDSLASLLRGKNKHGPATICAVLKICLRNNSVPRAVCEGEGKINCLPVTPYTPNKSDTGNVPFSTGKLHTEVDSCLPKHSVLSNIVIKDC